MDPKRHLASPVVSLKAALSGRKAQASGSSAAALQRLVEQRQITALRSWLGEDHDLLQRLRLSEEMGPCVGAAIDPRPPHLNTHNKASGSAAAPCLPSRTPA